MEDIVENGGGGGGGGYGNGFETLQCIVQDRSTTAQKVQ